jgi:tetratricopeptide (TPR) repeat protein
MIRGSAPVVVVCTAFLLFHFERLPAQTSPISWGVAVGIAEFDDVRIQKVPGADTSAVQVGDALQTFGLAEKNVQVRTNRKANTDAVRRILRTVLKERASAADSVFVFIAGSGRVDNAGGANEAYLMTYDSNPGAKKTTAFRLTELAQLIQESPAAGIYLTIDLTGDAMQAELEALAKSPRVVLSAVSSGPDLRLAAATARALSDKSNATAGQLLATLKSAASTQAFLEVRQPAAVLFAPALLAVVKPPSEPKPLPTPGPEEKTAPPRPPLPPPPPKPNPVTEAQQTAERVRALLDTARASRDSGRWAEAVNNCKSALKIDANSGEAVAILWSTYSSQETAIIHERKWDEVKKNLDAVTAAEASDPHLPEFRAQTAGSLTAEGLSVLKLSKWDDAAQIFKMALALKTTAEAAHGLSIAEVHSGYDAGRVAYQKQDFAAAKDKFEQVLKSQPSLKDQDLAPLFADAQAKSKKAGNELFLKDGIEKLNNGQYTLAREIFVRVLKDDPDDNRASTQLGRLDELVQSAKFIENAIGEGERELKKSDWQKAQTDFNDALARNPDDVRALNGRKLALEGIQRGQRNRNLAAAAVGIPISAFVVIFAPASRRARVYTRLGWNQRAARLFNRILERNPMRTDALVSLFGLYNSSGQRDAALALCLNYLRMKPDDARVLMLVGEAHYERLELEPARQAFQQILTADPANAIAGVRLLSIEDQAPGEPAVLGQYEKALAACPESAELNQLISRYYLRQGNRSPRALSVFRRALQADPANARLHLASAQAHWEQGNFEEAAASAKEAITFDPRDKTALSLFLGASANCGRLPDCFSVVDSGLVKGLGVLSVCEGIGALDPGLRPLIHERYTELLGKADVSALAFHSAEAEGEIERALYRAHLSLDDGSREAALTHVNEAISFDAGQVPVGSLAKSEQVRVLRRFLNMRREEDDFPQPYAAQLFRLGELHRELSESRAALGSFKEIARLPEWLVRCNAVMQDVLDGLPIEELAGVFFEEVEWEVRREAGRSSLGKDGMADLILNPPAASKSSLFKLFSNCKARCFARPVTLDDIVQLKRDLSGQEAVNGEYTFVVSPLRARQDVLALIYALLTEEPSLHVIPLEAAAVKQAVIDNKSADVIEQLLRLWVGQGDLFDVHSPIADAGTFFGRGQFIHTLTTKIIHRENFGIFGLRKVGKTSLVFQLRENLPKNLIGYVDLQSISSRRCDEIYFRLSAALRRELRIKFPDLPPISSRLTEFDASKSYPSLASDFHAELLAIKEALDSQGMQPRVLLLLDEIELLVPNNQSRGIAGFEDFFRQIRGLYQQEGFVLSGVIGADPNACRAGKWGERDNPIFQYYDEIFLSPLDRTECDLMVQGIGEVMGVSFEVEGLTRIYEESGGHPYVARQLCSSIVNRHTQRPLRVSAGIVYDGVEDYIAQRPDYFNGVFRGYITKEARQLLEVAAAHEANAENDVSRVDLLRFSTKAGLDRSLFDRALQDLELFHLLMRDRDRYHIKIRLLRRWIRKSWLGIE